MAFSSAMLAEFEKANGEFYKRLTIDFPKTVETVTLQPDATTLSDANHSAQGATTFHEAMDDPPASPDDDTTYVRHDVDDTRAESRVSFPSLPSWVVDVVRVRVFCRAKSNASVDAAEDDGGWIFAARVNGTNYFGAIENKRFFNPAHRTMVIEFEESPDTLTNWTIAEVNSLEVAIISQPDGVGDQFGQRFTQVYVEVDATRSRRGQYSDIAINSKADGLFEAKVIRWGQASYSVQGVSGAIQRPTCEAVVADMDQELNQIFSGSGVDQVRKSTVTIEYVSPNVDRDDWATVFTGLLTSWEERRPHEWTLGFAEDDAALNGIVPKAKISDVDFEDADPVEYDKHIQIVYGIHDSANDTNDGMIPCPNVDKVLWRRKVASHRVKRILRVFSKGNREDPALLRTEGLSAGNATTAQYQIITPIVGGRQYTLLEFNLTGASQEEIDKFNELDITADVEGIEEVGDGTGFLITNPATMIKHFLVNWVFNDYGSGSWFADSTAPIDLTLFQEASDFFDLVGQSSSRFIGGRSSPKTARQELNAWAQDLHVRVFWTEEGKLATLPHSPFSLDVYIDDPWFQQGLHDIGDPDFRYDTSELTDRILIGHFHQASSNAFLATIEVRDVEVAEQKVETIQSFWLPSGFPS